MYVGGISCLLGIGLALRSPSVAALSGAAFALSHAFVVLVEEPGLARRFGPSYDDYRRSTNRWLPRPPRNAPG